MGTILERLKAGSPYYQIEDTGDGGIVLIPTPEYRDEFSGVVRNLISISTDEFVILPTPDGHRRYSLAVILPL